MTVSSYEGRVVFSTSFFCITHGKKTAAKLRIQVWFRAARPGSGQSDYLTVPTSQACLKKDDNSDLKELTATCSASD